MSGFLSFIKLLPLEVGNIELKDCIAATGQATAKEAVLVPEIDDELKKLWTLSMFYFRRSLELKVSLAFKKKSPEDETEMDQYIQKAECLSNIFWVCIKSDYSLWKYPNLGLRDPWMIVQMEELPKFPNISRFLRGLQDMTGIEPLDSEAEDPKEEAP
jgi:hypothetical protein